MAVARDLDLLPPPDFDDFMAGFEGADKSAVQLPALASRDCNWRRCRFCAFLSQAGAGQFRHLSAGRFADILEGYVRRYGVSRFQFHDNNFAFSRSFLRDLAGRITQKGYSFSCSARTPLMDDELAGILAEAGAETVCLGVESMSQGLLDRMQKGTRILDNIRAIKAVVKHDIHLLVALLGDIPNETRREIEEYESNLALIEDVFFVPYLRGTLELNLNRVLFQYGSAYVEDAASHGLEVEPSTFARTFVPTELRSMPLYYIAASYRHRGSARKIRSFIQSLERRASLVTKEKALEVARSALRTIDPSAELLRGSMLLSWGYSDGDYIVIEDRRDYVQKRYVLDGSDRPVFLDLLRHTPLDRIYEVHGEEVAGPVIELLVKHRVIFTDHGSVVSAFA